MNTKQRKLFVFSSANLVTSLAFHVSFYIPLFKQNKSSLFDSLYSISDLAFKYLRVTLGDKKEDFKSKRRVLSLLIYFHLWKELEVFISEKKLEVASIYVVFLAYRKAAGGRIHCLDWRRQWPCDDDSCWRHWPQEIEFCQEIRTIGSKLLASFYKFVTVTKQRRFAKIWFSVSESKNYEDIWHYNMLITF